jgi:DNA-binding response OmpR family regulator
MEYMTHTILVVDDDESILEVVQLVLESEGYSVQTCTTGACLSDLEAHRPHLILLDVLLAGEDGRVLCQHLKSNEQTRTIPVILLSAQSYKAINGCGADDYLEKPFDVDRLLTVVHYHLTTQHINPGNG